MRIALLVFLTLTAPACRRNKPIEAAPAPTSQIAQAERAATQPPAPPPAPSEPLPDRTDPPSDDEIRGQLNRTFPDIARCVRAAKPGPGPFSLRFIVKNDGTVGESGLVGLPAASSCLSEIVTKLRFAPFRGVPVRIEIAVGPDGLPVTSGADGG